MTSGPITSWQTASRWGNNGNSEIIYSSELQNHCRWWLQPWNSKTLAPWKKSYNQPRQYIKKQRHYLATKVRLVKAIVFPVVMYGCWELGHKEGWALTNWCFWTVVLEKTLKSPLDCKDIKPVNPKGNQYWIFIGRTDAEAPILWPPLAKSRFIRRDPDAGKDWRQEKDERGWDGWMASPTQWTWVWTSSRSWWRTGKPGMLQSMGSQSQTQLRTEQQHCAKGPPWQLSGFCTLRRFRLQTPVFLGFLGGSDGKESTGHSGDLGLIPGLGRSPGEGNGNSFRYSCLENPMDRGAWQATIHGVAKSQTAHTVLDN